MRKWSLTFSFEYTSDESLRFVMIREREIDREERERERERERALKTDRIVGEKKVYPRRYTF